MYSPTNDNETEIKPIKKSWGKLLILFLALLLIDIVFMLIFCFDKVEVKKLYNKYKKIASENIKKIEKQDENPPIFQDYISDIQQKIKENWNPVKTNESKKVILLFKVYKDGKVTDIKVKKSSGNKEMDNSAIDAVLESSPLPPLPKDCEFDDVDILFNFDYNILNMKLDKNERK